MEDLKDSIVVTSNSSEDKNSYLELEETLIPYPDSFEIAKNNEISYILRLDNPYEYEKLILKSRVTKYDNEDYTTIGSRFKNLVNWYHSTVYNYNDEILDENNHLIFETSVAISKNIFEQLFVNKNMIKEQLFYNDLYLIKDNKFYRYILSRNSFIYRGTCNEQAIKDNIIFSDDLTHFADELLLILSNPKRGAKVYGERSYQNCIYTSGELAQIIVAIGSSKNSIFRMRKHINIYDLSLLNHLGIEDGNSIITSIFEIHLNK